jgi:hypothetical protein
MEEVDAEAFEDAAKRRLKTSRDRSCLRRDWLLFSNMDPRYLAQDVTKKTLGKDRDALAGAAVSAQGEELACSSANVG